jgi:uncharacterized membrane protein YbjE (DUF340 family)
MSQLVSMLSLIGALAAGILLGRIPVVAGFQSTRSFAAIRSAVLYVLVFTMGFRIGRTPEFAASILFLGLTALGFSAATIAGTLAVLALLFHLRRDRQAPPVRPDVRVERSTMREALKDPATLLLILVGGFLVGFFVPLFPGRDGSGLITAILYALLIVIGIGVSAGGVRIAEVFTHPNLFLIPLGTAVGSLIGGLAVGLAAGMRAGTALALSSGFGWYSLSGVILTRLDGPLTGSLAFLSNILRESMSLLLIPLLSRTRYPYLAIGAGGATSMDVTLPLIEKNCGPKSVGFAMASGGILSLAVPIMVPLLFGIGG